MVFDPSFRTDRTDRFQSSAASSPVEQGMRASTDRTDITKKYIKRNLKPYKTLRKKKYHIRLKKLKNLSENRIEALAIKSVMKKHGIERRKLNRKFDDKYKPKKIRRAKRRLARKPLTWKPKSKVVRHVQRVQQNRRIMRTNIWAGKGYDIRKGYR